MEEWTTIESDPGVFTELISEMGVRDVEVEEVYSMDVETLNTMRPVYGLVFLFKWQQESDSRPTLSFDGTAGRIFFAKQVVTNACATQALLAILLNRPDLELGEGLQTLKDFTPDFDPELKGQAIGNSEFIRTAHNSFRSANPLIQEHDKDEPQEGEAFHFIAYVPIQGEIYELDGLKPGPISLGTSSEEDWLENVLPHVEQRITRYSKSEIRFNLLALKKDHRADWREEIKVASSANQHSADGNGDSLLVAELKQRLATEDAKHAMWHAENARRKHNYFPFVFNLLRILGEENQLQSLIKIAETKPKPEDRDDS